MADSGHNADFLQEVNGDAVHYDEEQGEYGDEHDGQEQEAGSQTTEEEIPPHEATAPPSAYPQGELPPAPEVPPPPTSGASTSGGGRPKPQYQLKYTMAGAMPPTAFLASAKIVFPIGHTMALSSVKFSPDGQVVASTCARTSLHLFPTQLLTIL